LTVYKFKKNLTVYIKDYYDYKSFDTSFFTLSLSPKFYIKQGLVKQDLNRFFKKCKPKSIFSISKPLKKMIYIIPVNWSLYFKNKYKKYQQPFWVTHLSANTHKKIDFNWRKDTFRLFHNKIYHTQGDILKYSLVKKYNIETEEFESFVLFPFFMFKGKVVSRVFIFKKKIFQYKFYYRYFINRFIKINVKLAPTRLLIFRLNFLKNFYIYFKKFKFFKKFRKFFRLTFYKNRHYISFLYGKKQFLIFLLKSVKKNFLLSKKDWKYRFIKGKLNRVIKKTLFKKGKKIKVKTKKVYLRKKSKFKKLYLRFWFFFFTSRFSLYFMLRCFYSKFLMFHIFYKLFIWKKPYCKNNNQVFKKRFWYVESRLNIFLVRNGFVKNVYQADYVLRNRVVYLNSKLVFLSYKLVNTQDLVQIKFFYFLLFKLFFKKKFNKFFF